MDDELNGLSPARDANTRRQFFNGPPTPAAKDPPKNPANEHNLFRNRSTYREAGSSINRLGDLNIERGPDLSQDAGRLRYSPDEFAGRFTQFADAPEEALHELPKKKNFYEEAIDGLHAVTSNTYVRQLTLAGVGFYAGYPPFFKATKDFGYHIDFLRQPKTPFGFNLPFDPVAASLLTSDLRFTMQGEMGDIALNRRESLLDAYVRQRADLDSYWSNPQLLKGLTPGEFSTGYAPGARALLVPEEQNQATYIFQSVSIGVPGFGTTLNFDHFLGNPTLPGPYDSALTKSPFANRDDDIVRPIWDRPFGYYTNLGAGLWVGDPFFNLGSSVSATGLDLPPDTYDPNTFELIPKFKVEFLRATAGFR